LPIFYVLTELRQDGKNRRMGFLESCSFIIFNEKIATKDGEEKIVYGARVSLLKILDKLLNRVHILPTEIKIIICGDGTSYFHRKYGLITVGIRLPQFFGDKVFPLVIINAPESYAVTFSFHF
jgi:hypothetical protein